MSSKKTFIPIWPVAPGRRVLIKKGIWSTLPRTDNKRKAPFYASFLRASLTIEASIIIPLFITLMVFGMYTFRVLQVHSIVQQSIDSASRTMAVTLGNVSDQGETVLLASTVAMAAIELKEREVPLEFIDGGPLGFDFLESTADGNYIDLKVNYRMSFPVGLLGDYTYEISQRARCRKWVGYDKNENETDGNYVYITEHGEAYHINYFCTYLNPSVHKVAKDEVSEKRNKSGGRYEKCQRCGKTEPGGFLYITDYGNSYHNDVNCTEIKHTIKKVLLEEVKDTMRPCSKCTAAHK